MHANPEFRPLARALLATCMLTLGGCSPPEPARPVSLGGVSLGMGLEDYRKVASVAPGFHFAGVFPAGSVPEATFVDDRLATFRWKFAARDYGKVRAALAANYPEMRCVRPSDERETCRIGKTFSLWQGARGDLYSHVTLQKPAAPPVR